MRTVLPCDPPWTGFQSSPGVVQATGHCLAHSRAEGGEELVPGNTGLFQHAVQGAVLQFLVVWNDTPGRPASQDDVAPALRLTTKPSFSRAWMASRPETRGRLVIHSDLESRDE